MEKPIEKESYSFKIELGRLFFISIGVFLFILFFQPFPLDRLNYDDRLLFVTGFGAITFIFGCIVLILIPLLIPRWFKISEWESGPPYFLSVLLLIVTSTAFAFYIRYVGLTLLNLYIMFKVVLVCLIPILILIILYKNKSLERNIILLREINRKNLLKLQELKKSKEDEQIEIISDNKSKKLTLKYKNIISIKSADNYIEIYYLENDLVEKKLIRSTLRNIELQLMDQSDFLRCHRTSIVNIIHINELARNYSGYSLRMSKLEEAIPVSRQYLTQVKEAISNYE
jgi:plasmid maintenance system killer protein